MILPRSASREPKALISAGSSVIAPRTAIATTTIAPTAIERIVLELIRNSPASEISTVMPENATARPDVRMAVVRASSAVAPLWSSSRYLARMNSE